MQIFDKKTLQPHFRRYIQEHRGDPGCFVLNITQTRGSIDEIVIHRLSCGNITSYGHVSEEFAKRCGGKQELELWANRQFCGLKYCLCMQRYT